MEFYLKLNDSASLIKLEIVEEDDVDLNENKSNLIERIYKEIENKLDVESSGFALESNRGSKITSKSLINNGDTFRICPVLLGGKGGFGSLLRAFGKQITLSTNKEACRDLTGRRIRHVNNERKLKEFMSKQVERSKQKEDEKKEKAERRRKKRDRIENASHHLFVDPKYDEQKQKISQDLDDAIKVAAERERLNKKKRKNDENVQVKATTSAKSDGKSSAAPKEEKSNKQSAIVETKQQVVHEDSKQSKEKSADKFKDWMGVGDLDVSSSSDDEQANVSAAKKLKK